VPLAPCLTYRVTVHAGGGSVHVASVELEVAGTFWGSQYWNNDGNLSITASVAPAKAMRIFCHAVSIFRPYYRQELARCFQGLLHETA